MFCYFGTEVTQRFEDVADAVYQLEWYHLPLDIHKNLPLILALTHKKPCQFDHLAHPIVHLDFSPRYL